MLSITDKRSLLFNLQKPLEVPTEEFEASWWPLVDSFWTRTQKYCLTSGDNVSVYVCRLSKPSKSSTRVEGVPLAKRRVTSKRTPIECHAAIKVTHTAEQTTKVERYKDAPDHCHPLEDIDVIKLPKAALQLVALEAKKPYKPPSIVVAVKEIAREQGLGEVVDHLTRTKVANIQRTLRSSENAYLAGSVELENDIKDAIAFLQSKGYRHERFSAQRSQSQQSVSTMDETRSDGRSEGLFFAHPRQLASLTQYGWLTLMDATHGTNKHDWRLFTLYIRDKHSCWNVGGHFFVSHEDTPTVSKALTIVRDFAPRWEPRYMLSDDSAVEVGSVHNAFPGISKGEQNCDPIRCTVHTMRSWMHKIYVTSARNKMLQAMNKRTEIGCNMMIDQALKSCTTKEVFKTIKRYAKNTKEWALWARQHSPLLLQVTTTNPIESYHSELKRLTSKTHGLFGACIKIDEIDNKREAQRKKAESNFRTKRISVMDLSETVLEQVHKFPFPIQELIIGEARGMSTRIEKGKAPPHLTSPECDCLFFSRYLVPCRHILHAHMYGTDPPEKLLTIEDWKMFQHMFGETGMEVYRSRELVEVPVYVETEEERKQATYRLKANALLENVRNGFWKVMDRRDECDIEQFIEDLAKFSFNHSE